MTTPQPEGNQECKCELDGFQGAVWTGDCPIHGEVPNKEKWEEEFLMKTIYDGFVDWNEDETTNWHPNFNKIKDFIKQTLTSHESQVRDEIVSILVTSLGAHELGITKDKSTGEILRDIINIITPPQGETK